MIRITVEMVPKGDDERAYVMAQGIIANDGSGTLDSGNYTYGFSGQTNNPHRDPGIRTSGVLKGFPRKRLNVWHLIRLCLEQGDQKLVSPDGTGYQET